MELAELVDLSELAEDCLKGCWCVCMFVEVCIVHVHCSLYLLELTETLRLAVYAAISRPVMPQSAAINLKNWNSKNKTSIDLKIFV